MVNVVNANQSQLWLLSNVHHNVPHIWQRTQDRSGDIMMNTRHLSVDINILVEYLSTWLNILPRVSHTSPHSDDYSKLILFALFTPSNMWLVDAF